VPSYDFRCPVCGEMAEEFFLSYKNKKVPDCPTCGVTMEQVHVKPPAMYMPPDFSQMAPNQAEIDMKHDGSWCGR